MTKENELTFQLVQEDELTKENELTFQLVQEDELRYEQDFLLPSEFRDEFGWKPDLSEEEAKDYVAFCFKLVDINVRLAKANLAPLF